MKLAFLLSLFFAATSALETTDNRMIAYLGNWQSCPTAAQLSQYTHIVVAFAVSYTWSPGKNICSSTCQISNPPICNNAPNPTLVNQLHAQGKKVILSFGGAGMGGSWAGDANDCWEYCFGRETQVVNQLVNIVNTNNFDGVDLDYEYFYENNQNGSGFTKGAQAIQFLRDVSVGLRNSLPSNALVTHAPMDADLVTGSAYYDMLRSLPSNTLDFLMPQFYNGYTRPAQDSFTGSGVGSYSAESLYSQLVANLFGGDATRVVFGFCINDCGGTGSNANAAQAAAVLNQVESVYSCHGGAFFWVAQHDVNGAWSSTVNTAMNDKRGCNTGGVPPPPVVTQPPVVSTQPPVVLTQPPVVSTQPPVGGGSQCCQTGETGYKTTGDCSTFYYCQNGVNLGTIACQSGLLFDASLQVCNWANQVTCQPAQCGGGIPATDPPVVVTQPPVVVTQPPVVVTQPPVVVTQPPVVVTQPPVVPPTPVCVNDKWWRDTDCDKATYGSKKVCVLNDNTEPAMGETGDKCVPCVNHKVSGKDRGCTNRKPRCVTSNGSDPALGYAGTKCVA